MSTLSGGPNIVSNGLILYLDAANTRSYPGTGTIWTDISRGGNNGTLTNGPTFSNNNRGGIVFDGINDNINIPYSGSTSNSFTFIIIAKCNTMDSNMSNRQTLFGLSQNNNPAYQQFDLEVWGNTGIGFRGNGGTVSNVDFFTYFWDLNVNANDINMYAVTLNSSGHTIYVNGILKNTINQSYTSNFNTIYLASRNSGNFWNGSCYVFYMYNRILTAQEILQNYNATKTRFILQ